MAARIALAKLKVVALFIASNHKISDSDILTLLDKLFRCGYIHKSFLSSNCIGNDFWTFSRLALEKYNTFFLQSFMENPIFCNT